MRNFEARRTPHSRATRARRPHAPPHGQLRHEPPHAGRPARFREALPEDEPPFAHWTLATGKPEAIRALGAALELDYLEEDRSFTHNLRTAVLDPDGKLRRLFRGNEWTPEELVAELKAAAGA
jgi:cytochrome oxidase Cu insertion factor (SCO1/SenC/PrrC family)